MSFNLPANRLLKVTKGSWATVKYPTTVFVQANLCPRDYFEPVDPNTPRSCVPAGGKGFSFLFDSNSGKMTLHGPDVLQPLSVTFEVENGTWNAVFVGRCMQVSQVIESEDALDQVLTHVEYTLPSLLSVATNLSIFCESIEVALGDEGDQLAARAETCIPSHEIKIVEPDARVDELRKGIELFGLARSSARFTLAASYLREGMFFVSSYHAHNPYTHSLVAILKCSQAIEVLFSSDRETIRARCRKLSIDDGVIESQIIPIVVARSALGSAHASAFMPDHKEVEVLRRFARRSVHTVRQLLLHVDRASDEERAVLSEQIKRSRDEERLLERLKKSLDEQPWSVDGGKQRNVEIMNDPRLSSPGDYFSSHVLYRISSSD